MQTTAKTITWNSFSCSATKRDGFVFLTSKSTRRITEESFVRFSFDYIPIIVSLPSYYEKNRNIFQKNYYPAKRLKICLNTLNSESAFYKNTYALSCVCRGPSKNTVASNSFRKKMLWKDCIHTYVFIYV